MSHIDHTLTAGYNRASDPPKSLGNTATNSIAGNSLGKNLRRKDHDHWPATSTTNPERERRALVDS